MFGNEVRLRVKVAGAISLEEICADTRSEIDGQQCVMIRSLIGREPSDS